MKKDKQYYILMPGDNMINIEEDEFKRLQDQESGWLNLYRDDGFIRVNISQIVTCGYYITKKPSSIVLKNGN